jgi:hypothetical protein
VNGSDSSRLGERRPGIRAVAAAGRRSAR